MIISIKERVQFRLSALTLWVRQHIPAFIIILLLSPILYESWNIANALYAINSAAQKGARYAATGAYDQNYCPGLCNSSDLVDVARLKSAYQIIQAEIGRTIFGTALPIENVKITICSDQPGYRYEEENNVCIPSDSVSLPGGSQVVSVGYDYSLGAALGTGRAIIPMRAQQTGMVERFRVSRVINAPPPINQEVVSDQQVVSEQQDGGEKLVVVTGNLQLVADNVSAVAKQIISIANTSGGYVVQSDVGADGNQKYANVQIRIPAEQFEAVLEQVKGLGNQVVQENINGKDVTEEYVDIKGRLRGLQATATQLDELLKKAQTVDDALKVHAQLGKLQQEIEQLTGKKAYLENQAALATLKVTLSTTYSAPAAEIFVWQPTTTIQKAWQFLTAAVYLAGDLLIWALIVGLPIGLLVWVVRKIMLRLWKRKSINP